MSSIHGICGLFSDCVGFYQLCPIPWDIIAVGPGPRFGSREHRVLHWKSPTSIRSAIQLLFERFLNPERVSMPDIDMDFCYERRQEVIDYVVEKYGKDQVVQIVTFGTLAPRVLSGMWGVCMDLPYSLCDPLPR